MAYSDDLRQRVLHYVHSGGSKTQAAQLFQVGLRTVHVWQAQGRHYQRGKPGPRGSRKFDRQTLAKMVQKQPDLLLKEMAAHLGVSINTMHHALKCMGIGRKKKRCSTPKPSSPSVTLGANTSSSATTKPSRPNDPSCIWTKPALRPVPVGFGLGRPLGLGSRVPIMPICAPAPA